MQTIQISLGYLQNQIDVLKRIVAGWESQPLATCEIQSTGASAEEVTKVMETYEDIYFKLIHLMRATIQFLEKTEETYRTTDNKIGDKILSSIEEILIK